MIYDIIIIGAGCAGLTAAVYASRAGKSVLILESDTVGGQISSSPKVENFPSIKEISGAEFSDNLFEQAASFGAQFALEKVTGITDGEIKTIIAGSKKYECRRLIIATGLKHRKLGIQNESDFEGRGISYCAVCDGMFFKDGTVAVAGGGDVALVNALFLANICKKVYVIHRRDEFRAESVKIDEIKSKPNIELLLSSNIVALEGNDFLESITIEYVNSKEQKNIAVDGLFVCIGHVPDNEIFKGLVDLDDDGYIIAGEDCKTNVEGIFAAGDCRVKSLRQLTTASADGSVAAVAACADN